jgi:hypothetical protein
MHAPYTDRLILYRWEFTIAQVLALTGDLPKFAAWQRLSDGIGLLLELVEQLA